MADSFLGAERLSILFAMPAFWPATAFGGPIPVARSLTRGLAARGHRVEIVTTTLLDVERGRTWRSRTGDVDGVRVRYLATPLRYRWMGVTPSLPLRLSRLPRPDVVHVFGYRDVVTTLAAAWCRRHDVPYVFEPLDMYVARFRNVPLKRVFDVLVGRRVATGAARVIAVSGHERLQLVAAGLPPERVAVRPNGFPEPYAEPRDGQLRSRLGIAPDRPLVLNVGRISFKKGLDLLLEALAGIPEASLVVIGPDDGDGTRQRLESLRADPRLAGRVHLLPLLEPARTRAVYPEADLFVLPSRNESFGLVAAEAAAAGVPVLLTDQCGVAEFLDGGGVVVPCDAQAIREGIQALLADPERRGGVGAAGRAAASRHSWDAVVEQQEALYRDVVDG